MSNSSYADLLYYDKKIKCIFSINPMHEVLFIFIFNLLLTKQF